MSDQGLSIFDHEPEDSETSNDDEATQVIPVTPDLRRPSGSPRRHRRRAHPPQPATPRPTAPAAPRQQAPAARPQAQPPVAQPSVARARRVRRSASSSRRRPAPGPPGPPSAGPGAAGGAVAPSARPGRAPADFAVVRRGYDRDAVDAHLRRLTAEKAGLGSSLAEVRAPAAGLEQRARARCASKLEENENPSYAGLGGRASAMLRLAEEEAAEVRDQRPARRRRDPRAGQPRRARRSAPRPRREAEDMRHRPAQGARGDPRPACMADAEQERALAPGRGRGPARLRQARGRPAPARRPAGDQRAAHRAPSARPSRPVPPPTGRCRRPGARWPWRRSAWPVRPPSTTPAPRRRPSDWSRRPRSAPPPPSSGPARRRSQATQQRQQARQEAEALLSRSRREAEQIVGLGAEPGRRAHRISGNADAERELPRLKAEVDRMTKRRDAITAQLSSLRDVVAGLRRRRREPLMVGSRVRQAGRGRLRRAGPPDRDRGRRPEGRRRGGPGLRPGLGPSPDHSPFYIGFFGAVGALLAVWLGQQLIASVSSMLILIVVALFLAFGLNPLVEWLHPARPDAHLGGAAGLVLVRGRAGAVRPRDRARGQPTRSPRSPTTPPGGSTSCSTTARSSGSTTSTTSSTRPRTTSPAATSPGRSSAACSGVGLAVPGRFCQRVRRSSC